MDPKLSIDNRELQCRGRKRIIKPLSYDDLVIHSLQVLGIVQVLGDTQTARRLPTSERAEEKSRIPKTYGARKFQSFHTVKSRRTTVKYVMITVGCGVCTYLYHRLLKWLKSFDNSLNPEDNW